MSDALNTIDTLLQATSPRLLAPATAAIILDTTTPIFHINTSGVADPTSISFTARLIEMEGTVTFSSVGGTLTSISGNTCVLLASNMPGTTATVTAELTYRGTLFSSTVSLSKVVDGATGDDGENGAAGSRGAGAFYASGTVWSDATANGATPGENVLDDIVTIFNGSTFAETKRWNGTAWVVIGAIYNGVLISDASVTDTKLIGLSASKVTGQLTNSQIADLAATKVTGQLVNSQIADLAATKVTGTLTNTQIADLAAAKITGQITGTQITDGAISTPKIAAGSVTTATLAAGAITAEKMSIGTGQNLLRISTFPLNIDGWYNEGNDTGLTLTFNRYPVGTYSFGETAYVNIQGAPANGTSSTVRTSAMIPVAPSTRYEASMYINTHRATAHVSIVWVDVAGAYISQSDGSHVVNHNSNGNQIASYSRSSVFATSPSNAAFAVIYVITGYDGQSDPYTFFLRGYMAEAKPNQTTPSPWAPSGVTQIEGGQITTDSITANQIAADAITANEIAANAVTSAKINAGAITAGKIAAGAIVADDIASNAITAAKIQAGAVTAGKIAAGSIVAGDIAADAISSDKILANAITAVKIAAAVITTDKIAANTISAGNIAASAITAEKIATDAVTADKVAANAITAAKVETGAITADKISVTSLSAISANFGSATIATGGYLNSGQTAYNTGTGFWIGTVSETPKFSIGAAGGNRLTWDGTTLSYVGAVELPPFTVSITGDIDETKDNTVINGVTVGTLSASVTGGRGTLIYTWTADSGATSPDTATGLLWVVSATASSTAVKAKVSQTNTSVAGKYTLTVTDADSRVATAVRLTNIQFGTPV